MAEIKTKANDLPVADFINGIANEQARQDCWKIAELMQAAAGAPARMWGTSIVGFGTYQAVYANGKTVDWLKIGFSPRKQALTLYLSLGGLADAEERLARLGKHTRGGGCLYIKKLADVDLEVLRGLMEASVAHVSQG